MAELSERHGLRFVSNLMRDRYHEKVAALRRHFNASGDDLERFIKASFPGEFRGTDIEKRVLIGELLKDDLRLEHWAFVRGKLRDLAYLTDRRHPEEYATDLALGWITEEWIRKRLNAQAPGRDAVKLIGIDAEREFSDLTIRANADFAVEKGGRPIRVDLMVDFLGTWQQTGVVDLKKGKVGHMKKGTVDWVLAFDLQRSLFYLIGAGDLLGLKFSANAAMGGNQTLKVPLPEEVPLDRLYRNL